MADIMQDVRVRGTMGAHAGSWGGCGGWVKPPAP